MRRRICIPIDQVPLVDGLRIINLPREQSPPPSPKKKKRDSTKYVYYVLHGVVVDVGEVGDKVEARFDKRWSPCKITSVNEDGTYDVLYGDGNKESNVPAKMIRRLMRETVLGYELDDFVVPDDVHKGDDTEFVIKGGFFVNKKGDLPIKKKK